MLYLDKFYAFLKGSMDLPEKERGGDLMPKKPFPTCVTEATVTLPDGTVKNLQNLSNNEKELLSRYITKSTFEAAGLKVTFQETVKMSIG